MAIVAGKQSVRLTAQELNLIFEAVNHVASEQGFRWECISLFGSRTDLNKRGGDIDLYVKVVSDLQVDRSKITRHLRIHLADRLGEQKFDLVLDDGKTDLGPFGELVKNQKVDLWIQSS